MAHELRCSIWQIADEADQVFGGIVARPSESGEMVCRFGVASGEDAIEVAAQAAHGDCRGAGFPSSSPRVEGKIEGFSDPADTVLVADLSDCLKDGGDQVSVFMGIEVGRPNACCENAFDLGRELGQHVPSSGYMLLDQFGESGRQFPFGPADAGALDHLEVDADIEGGVLARQLDGIFKCGAGGHQSG